MARLVRERRAAGFGEEEQERRPGERDEARQSKRNPKPDGLRKQPYRLQPGHAPHRRRNRSHGLGRRPRPSRKQLGSPGSENGRGGGGERAPEHVAEHEDRRPGDEAEAGRYGGGGGERCAGDPAAEAVGQETPGDVGRSAGDSRYGDQLADPDGTHVQDLAGEKGEQEAGRLEEHRQQRGGAGDHEQTAAPRRFEEESQRRAGEAYPLPGAPLGKPSPDQREIGRAHV